ncbi:MAG: ribonuclease HIII [Erysipelotrichaceae bacterium]
MNTITLLLNDKQINQLKNTWMDYLNDTIPPYALFQLKCEQCTITCYESKKVVFQGKDALVYASPFQEKQMILTDKSYSAALIKDHAGSDEVGTGDYFGPVVVAACVVLEKDIAFLKELKVNDSKVVKDEMILKIAPSIMKRLPHSLLILDNAKYNEVHKTNNLNKIKAKLHNQAYLHLSSKCSIPSFCVIDQFTPEKSYYGYLKDEKEVYTNLHFETKAESKYLAVACASIIARFAFLKAWQHMEETWDMSFNKGASSKVDEDILSFVDKYDENSLYKVAKVHFKNTNILYL